MPDTPIQWPTLDRVRLAAAEYFGKNVDDLTGLTRVDELTGGNELLTIDFLTDIEIKFKADIPDYEITTTATLAQLAGLVEKRRVKGDG